MEPAMMFVLGEGGGCCWLVWGGVLEFHLHFGVVEAEYLEIECVMQVEVLAKLSERWVVV